MKKRVLLLLIFSIFLVSFLTFILILNYLDPYQYMILGLASIIISFIMSFSSFFTLILYFIKKVYFRGKVFTHHVLISFRQSFLISLFFLSLIFFYNIGGFVILTGFLSFFILFLVELLFKNLEN